MGFFFQNMDNVYKLCNFAILNTILISLFQLVKKKKQDKPLVQIRFMFQQCKLGGGDLEKDPRRGREGITDMT